MEFTGFPSEGIQFLRELTENNNKTWFEANKKRFTAVVQEPAVALVAALGAQLQQQFPEITYDTRTNGSGSLMRMHRDTRFSADKSPYKTNVAMMFVNGSGKKMEKPGFGFQITPSGVDVVGGIFAFSKPQLTAFREAVLAEKSGLALDEAVANVRAAGSYQIGGETYKRVPTGYDASHPRAHWLKFTGLNVYPPQVSLDIAATPAFVDVLMTHFVNIAPVRDWLLQHVDPA